MPVSRTAKRSAGSSHRRPRLGRRDTSTITSPSVGELDGVADEVEQDLPQPLADRRRSGVGHVGRRRRTTSSSPFSCARDARAAARRRRACSRRSNGGRLELELAGLDLREVEDVVDEPQQRVGRRCARSSRYSRCSGVSARVERQLGHAEDAVHRRADLVAHVREELALGAVGGLGGLLGLEQLAGALGDERGELSLAGFELPDAEPDTPSTQSPAAMPMAMRPQSVS